jgi:4,5-DOPA dioxygenase extradiol
MAASMTARMPTIFVGHGSPLNAMLDNEYTRAWSAIGAGIPRPSAVLAVSAHWYLPGTAVTAMAAPPTIHDFGGFPRELYEVQYPAPGSPELAERVQRLLMPLGVAADHRWGLDHGTWSVLLHLLPSADVPVVQLSIDATKPAQFHYDIGRKLSALRDEGVLVLGSGNLVHNLHAYAWGRHAVEPFDWALRFEAFVRAHIAADDPVPLVGYEAAGRDAILSVPTPEHYLPLLAVLGARHEREGATFPVEGIDGGSISMLSVRVG